MCLLNKQEFTNYNSHLNIMYIWLDYFSKLDFQVAIYIAGSIDCQQVQKYYKSPYKYLFLLTHLFT